MTAATKAPRATELACEDVIVAAAKLAGWFVHGERTSLSRSGRYATAIKGHKGWPDLVLLHPYHRRLLVVELKRRPNKVEPEQRAWHEAFATVGIDVQVWWVPECLPTVLAIIAGGVL